MTANGTWLFDGDSIDRPSLGRRAIRPVTGSPLCPRGDPLRSIPVACLSDVVEAVEEQRSRRAPELPAALEHPALTASSVASEQIVLTTRPVSPWCRARRCGLRR